MAISLRYRDALPPVVADELENLVASIRGFLRIEHNEDGTHVTRPRGFDFVPVGAISPYAGATAPEGWLLCDGSQVNRVTYAALFAVCGTTYGAGDGSTTFNLPDLRQRFPLGKAASGTGATLGATGGAIDHTHAGGSHTHSIGSDGTHAHGGATGDEASHTHGFTAPATATFYPVDNNADGAQITVPSTTHTHTGTTGAGSAHAHTVDSDGAHDHGGATGGASGSTDSANPPFIALNFIIQAGV